MRPEPESLLKCWDTMYAQSGIPEGSQPEPLHPSWIPIATLVIWLVCLAIGGIGLVVGYSSSRPTLPSRHDMPIEVEMLEVELSPSSSLEPVVPVFSEQSIPQPTTLPEDPAPASDLPQLGGVAVSEAEVAFPLPFDRQPRVQSESPLNVASATGVQSVGATAKQRPVAGPTSVQTLTFGSGEGRQPAPDYPIRARQAGQEGWVKIRFSVGENGKVISAQCASPSPWPLLNDSALRVIRERWRFRSGPTRHYEVIIRFELRR